MDALLAQASSWDPLETTFYTSSLLYTLGSSASVTAGSSTSAGSLAAIPFPSSLGPFYVAHSPLSGSVALLRNPSVPVPYSGAKSSVALHKGVGIYSSSGQPIVRFPLDDTGDVDGGGGSSSVSLSQRPANWSHPSLLAFDRRGRLVVLEEGGRYRIYAINSATFSSHTIANAVLQQPQPPAQPVEGLKVIDAKAYPGGFIARLNSGAFWDIPLEGGRPTPLASPPAAVTLTNGAAASSSLAASTSRQEEAWCVIGPDEAPLGVATVYVSRGKTVYTLDRDEAVDQRIDKGPFLKLLPSPSGRLLALLLPPTSPGSNSSANAFPSLWVVSSTFSQSHSTLPPLTLLGLDSRPVNQREEQRKLEDAQWCANDSIICSWSWNSPGGRKSSKVVVCGPAGGFLDYPSATSEPPLLLPTPAGLSLLSTSQHRFLATVPYDLQQLVLATNPEPAAARLLQAHAHFLKGNPKSYALITQLRSAAMGGVGGDDETLKAGVRTLVSIVKHLTVPSDEGVVQHAGTAAIQKQILAAAAWGRGFLEEYERDGDEGVVIAGQGLRVLNALSNYTVGIPLSWQQYESIDKHLLLSLLTSRSLHLLALRLAAFLDLPTAPVLAHWAKTLVSSETAGTAGSEADAALVRRIKGKLGKGKGGIYESVAREAWKAGRRGLALSLLELESRMEQGVELLLSMREDRQALDKAVQSGDTDLVYNTLLTLRSKLALGDFFKLVDELPVASALLEVYARDSETVHLNPHSGAVSGGKEREMLKDFYWQDDRRRDGALLALEEGALATDPNERLACFKLAGKTFGEDRDLGFESKMMDEAYRLLSHQQTLEKEAEPAMSLHVIGLSVNETISALLKVGLAKKADRVRADFKVPDRRFYFIKLQALTAIKDWPSLEAFAKARKSPIGYEPFVNHLVAKGHPREAAKHVQRCDAKNRVDLFVKCGDWSKAAVECKERNDKARLEQLRSEAPTTLIKREVEAIISTMGR